MARVFLLLVGSMLSTLPIGTDSMVSLGKVFRDDPAAPGCLLPIGHIVLGIVGLRLFGGD